LAPLLPDFSFPLHFLIHFFPLRSRLLSMPFSRRCVR
jgi:hypothetical protein